MEYADKKAVGTPYKDLFIYIIKGIVPAEAENALGEDFMGNWVEDDSSFLFFSLPSEEAVNRLLKGNPQLALMETHCFPYEQWQGGGFASFRVGDFVVVPPWERPDVLTGGIRILLDPGVVFGNGLHPTTRDCLKAMALTNRQKPFRSALDLGTGTGVLALAAAFLGAERVLAVDINPLCVKTAANNVKLNGLDAVVRVVQGKAESHVHEAADLIIANIHHEVIRGLLDNKALAEAERIIISGLLRSQFRDVRSRLHEMNFEMIREWDHDMTWFTVLAGRKVDSELHGKK